MQINIGQACYINLFKFWKDAKVIYLKAAHFHLLIGKKDGTTFSFQKKSTLQIDSVHPLANDFLFKVDLTTYARQKWYLILKP